MNRLPLEQKVLSENDRLASELRARFHAHGTLCVNLISAPGSGKTYLLERTLERLNPVMRAAVLTGDIETQNDANRLRRYGFPVRQITTGGTCHLDARMIERALHLTNPVSPAAAPARFSVAPAEGAPWSEQWELLLIENVGNLVCPSSYDLGEDAKIVLMSVTEGEDKPLKYPSIFYKSALLLLTKTDLLPHLQFDLSLARENARRANPAIEILEVSALTGTGMEAWMKWLQDRQQAVRGNMQGRVAQATAHGS